MIGHKFPEITEIFLNEPLNKRLGTIGLKTGELAIEAGKRNISMIQLITMPERDGLEYTSIKPKDGRAYVCSSYIVAFYKEAGLFEGLDIEANEFTPKDLYELNFFDNKWVSQDLNCLTDNPDQPFCQFIGKYRMIFHNYGTIAPYSHMNERCPMIPQHFIRPLGC